LNLARQFDRENPPKAWVPSFHSNSVVLGTLPDNTFGGLVLGLSEQSIEKFLARTKFGAIPRIQSFAANGTNLEFDAAVLAGKGYRLESSTQLLEWLPGSANIAAQSNRVLLSAPLEGSSAFFRLEEGVNDNFTDRVRVAGALATFVGNNLTATAELGEPNHAYQALRSLWWEWTPPITGRFTFNRVKGSQILRIYSGKELGLLSPLTPFFAEHQTINVDAGTPVEIAIDSPHPSVPGGKFTFTVSPSAENDDYSNATILSGTIIEIAGNNFGASAEENEPDPWGHSVWWTWVAPSNGLCSVSVANSTLFSSLTIFTGNDVGSLLPVGNAFGVSNGVTIGVSGGTRYTIRLDAYDIGEFLLRLSFRPGEGRFPITLRPSPAIGGSISVSPPPESNGGYAVQVDITTTASPAPGFIFDSWTSPLAGKVNPLFIPAPLPEVIEARFRPANDDFASRIKLIGYPVMFQGALAGATAEPMEQPSAKTIWWSWTSSSNFGVTISARGTPYSLKSLRLGAAQGISVAALTNLIRGTSRAVLGVWESELRFNSRSRAAYQIFADGEVQRETGAVQIQLDVGNPFAPPANDDFRNRSPLNGTQIELNGTTEFATREASEPSYYGETGQSVWWSWTPPDSGLAILRMSKCDFVPQVAIFTGDELSTLQEVSLVNGRDLDFMVVGGRTYFIRVDGTDGGQGAFKLDLLLNRQLLNDYFANAIPLGTTNAVAACSNETATREFGEPNHDGYAGGHSVWWSWTPSLSSWVSISTRGSNFDTLLAVYQGGWSEVIAADDDGGGDLTSEVLFFAEGSTTYYIAVDGYAAQSGQIFLEVIELSP
jgi:hypothetical protein